MTIETTPLTMDPPGHFQFSWVPETIFHPKRVFARVAAIQEGLWLTPMLILTLTTLLRLITVGWLKTQAAASGNIPLPTGWEWYTPDQQTQYMQTMQVQQGPVFMYVLPVLGGLLAIWIGWLLVGGLLHLVLTLLGGRGSTGAAMNVVAWAGLVWAVRDLVRVVYMLVTHKLIASPGLAGFAPASEGAASLFLVQLLTLVDLYLIWHILLTILGVCSGNSLSRAKAIFGVTLSILVVILAQAGLSYLAAGVGNLTITRPFFF